MANLKQLNYTPSPDRGIEFSFDSENFTVKIYEADGDVNPEGVTKLKVVQTVVCPRALLSILASNFFYDMGVDVHRLYSEELKRCHIPNI